MGDIYDELLQPPDKPKTTGRQLLANALQSFTYSLSQGMAAAAQAPGRRGTMAGQAAALGAPMQLQAQQQQRSAQEQQAKQELMMKIAAARQQLQQNQFGQARQQFDMQSGAPGQAMTPPAQTQTGGVPLPEAPNSQLPNLPIPLPNGQSITAPTQEQVTGGEAARQYAMARARGQAEAEFRPPPTPPPSKGFSSSPLGIFNQDTGQVTTPAPAPKPPVQSVDAQEMADWISKNPGKGPSDYAVWKAGITKTPRGDAELTPNQEALLIDRLSKQWIAASQPQRELKRQQALMEEGLKAAKGGNLNAGSQAVLVTFQKILDPSSVVRESEYARSPEGLSLMARIQGAMTRLGSGGAGVPLAELEQFANLAREMVKGAGSYAASSKKRIGMVADKYKISRDLLFEDEAPEAAAPSGKRKYNPATGKIE